MGLEQLNHKILHDNRCFWLRESPVRFFCRSNGDYLFVATAVWQTLQHGGPLEPVETLYMSHMRPLKKGDRAKIHEDWRHKRAVWDNTYVLQNITETNTRHDFEIQTRSCYQCKQTYMRSIERQNALVQYWTYRQIISVLRPQREDCIYF